MYFAFVSLGIHGGPLDKTRNYLLNKILGHLRNPFVVLEVDEIVRLWEVLYLIPSSFPKKEEEVLCFALLKAAKTTDGNSVMANEYVWSFDRANRRDLLKTFLGFLMFGNDAQISEKKEDEEEVIVDGSYGPIPQIIMEGEPSEGLSWWKGDKMGIVREEGRLYVGWTPKVREMCVVEEPVVIVEEPMGTSDEPTCTFHVEEVVEKPGSIGRSARPRFERTGSFLST
jgi:hypothetical protein